MALTGSDPERLEQLSARPYKEQAVWFLNAFWGDFGQEKAEQIWDYCNKFGELDLVQGKEGHELDELNAHRFLEAFEETMTVREMREKLRNKGALKGTIAKKVALTHFLTVRFDVDWVYLVHAPQGDNKEEIEEAQRKLDAVVAAFKESEARAEEAKAAVREAQAREAEAKKREQEALDAQKELEAALAELKAQEDAYNAKTEDLKKRSEEGGVVSRNKAKNMLAQHLGEDPLPLRKAKIDQEAAVRKAEKATAAAAEARKAAESARADAEAAKAAAEAAVEEARKLVAEAEAFLEEIKSKPGNGQGAIWWMERELYEQKKFLPLSKGGIVRK